jgi:hypothetical protein
MTTNKPNNIKIDPMLFYNDYCWRLSEPAVIDGSFIKLREVVIGYRIPLKTDIIRNLRCSIIGRNLALLYRSRSNNIRIDPETAYGSGAIAYGIESFQVPPFLSIGFNLRFDF